MPEVAGIPIKERACLRILILEDDPRDAELVKHREPIHLLLTDIVMPGMNGRELAKVFTHLHPEARVVFMSGYTDDEVLRRDVSQGRTWYLQKPFLPDALARKVREALGAAQDAVRARA